MILTERAAEIAAEAARRKDPAAGIKPGQRLLFDGIQRQAGDPPVVIRLRPAVFCRPRASEAEPAVFYLTMPETNVTLRHMPSPYRCIVFNNA